MAVLGGLTEMLPIRAVCLVMQRVGVLLIPLYMLFDMMATAIAQDPNQQDLPRSAASENCSAEGEPCREGLLLPMWKPQGNLSTGDKAARATVYMAAMIYMFLGVSIVADRFMAAIEVITSKFKEKYICFLKGVADGVTSGKNSE